jgi:hypothetical protein
MPPDTLVIAALGLGIAGVTSFLLWRFLRRRADAGTRETLGVVAPVEGRPEFPASGLLVPEGVLRSGDTTSAAIWEALEVAAAPVALEYYPVTDLEIVKYRTAPVNATVQQSLVEIVKAINPKNPTLFRVILPKGAELVRAVGTTGFRGFARNGTGITAQAILKPVAVGGAVAAGWPVFAVAGTVLVMDMVAQRELRAHQRRIESILGRQEERYYIERVKDQRSADTQLSRAISLMLDGHKPNLELALKSADDEFHRAQQFLQKYRGVIDALADGKGKVDFRRLDEALGGKTRDTDYFVRELHLARAAIALRRKALIADAAAVALADPTNPYAALRKFLGSQVHQLEEADGVATELAERLTQIELKGRWHDAATRLFRGADNSLVARQLRLRAQVAVPEVDSQAELRFIATPSGEILQVLPSDAESA